MRKLAAVLFLLLVLGCGSSSAQAESGDVPGSKDYPGIGRFGGSVITGYEAKDFDATASRQRLSRMASRWVR